MVVPASTASNSTWAISLAAGPAWTAWTACGERSERGALSGLCAYVHTPDDAAARPSLPGPGLSFFKP